MAISPLSLSYCTNVHPGRSVAEVIAGLERYTASLSRNVPGGVAAGLWLARSVVSELLATPDGIARFADRLRNLGLSTYTLNAFPFGDFHSTRVKENVYLPDWTSPDRLSYTLDCAKVLAALLPDGTHGSISTVPLGFKGFVYPAGFEEACLARLTQCATGLAQLGESTGKTIRLAIEPEPLCILETTGETLAFFERLMQRGQQVREHIGVCYDVCHQAVEFEDIAASIAALDKSGVRINKVHISCAIELADPMNNPEGRSALARYVEERYLHQTTARRADGTIARHIDLSREFIDSPPADFADASAWRVHFHVPVNAERLGPLGTTRSALREALGAIAALDHAPHIEVETYTWEVLPGAGSVDLVEGLTREMLATQALLGGLKG